MQFIQSLSGVQLDDNATIFSVTATEMSASDASILITLLATEGGSQELTDELSARVNTTAQETGLEVTQPPIRFGELYSHINKPADPHHLIDGCVAETTVLPPLEEDGLEVVLMWPESDLGETVPLQCPCGNLSALGGGTINRTATRTCGGTFSLGAAWEPEMAAACNFSSATRKLCQVANVRHNHCNGSLI